MMAAQIAALCHFCIVERSFAAKFAAFSMVDGDELAWIARR